MKETVVSGVGPYDGPRVEIELNAWEIELFIDSIWAHYRAKFSREEEQKVQTFEMEGWRYSIRRLQNAKARLAYKRRALAYKVKAFERKDEEAG